MEMGLGSLEEAMKNLEVIKTVTFIVNSAELSKIQKLEPRVDSDVIMYEKQDTFTYNISELYFVKDVGRVINPIGSYREDTGLT